MCFNLNILIVTVYLNENWEGLQELFKEFNFNSLYLIVYEKNTIEY